MLFYEFGANVLGVVTKIGLLELMLYVLPLGALVGVFYSLKGHKYQMLFTLASAMLSLLMGFTFFMIYYMSLWSHGGQSVGWLRVLW